jgi:hypothetical protein
MHRYSFARSGRAVTLAVIALGLIVPAAQSAGTPEPLLFQGCSDDFCGLFKSDIDETSPVFVGDIPDPYSLSPNGQMVAYRDGDSIRLHAIRGENQPDAFGDTDLTADAAIYTTSSSTWNIANSLRFSPDGGRIIFSETRSYLDQQSNAHTETKIRTVETLGLHTVATLLQDTDYAPSVPNASYSADGTKIVLVWATSTPGSWGIYTADPDGTDLAKLPLASSVDWASNPRF